MAVKVMWAPALSAQRDAAAKPASRAPEARKPEAARPKRRKTSVYDADGNEIFITLMCLKCHKMRPLSQFGLRRMADGAIRNQPWCRPCRSDASPKKRKEAAETVDPSVSGESPIDAEVREPCRDAGLLAAEVAAALHRGRS
jgi:hypothetical protein